MALTRPKYSQIYDTDYKQSVRVATTGDVGTLLVAGGAPNTVDTVTLILNDRVLVKDQTASAENGIYRVTVVGTGVNGTWIRDHDADASDKVTSGLTTTVAEGVTNIGRTYKLTTLDPITLGSTLLTFANPFAATATGLDTQVLFNNATLLAGATNLHYFTGNGVVLASAGVVSTSTTTGTLQVTGGIGASGNINAGNIIGTTATFTNYQGTLLTASQPNITTLGGVTSIGASGTTTLTGILQTAGQTNVTSLGTLTSLATGAITTTDTLALNAAGGLTTNQTTFLLANATATTLNIGGAATTLNIGAATGTLNLNNATTAIAGIATVAGVLYANSAVDSTTYTDGGLVAKGGVGVAGNVHIQSSKILHIGPDLVGAYSNVLAQFNANVNSYTQILLQNISSGTSASSDYICVADTGTDSINYIDHGINSSNYSDVAYTIGTGLDGYSYTNGGNYAIGTQTSGKGLIFHTGGTLSANKRVTINDTGLTVNTATVASSISTGALVVNGGVGVAGHLWIGGNLYVTNVISSSTQSISSNAPLLYLVSSNPYPYNYDLGFYSAFTGGPANVYAHTGMIRNDADSTWYLFSNVAEPTGGQVSLTNAIYDPLSMGALTINGTSVTGTGGTAIINAGTSGVGNIGAAAGLFNTVYASKLQGVIQTASHPLITTLGGVTSIGASGTTTITGILQTAAQTNITSVGTLSALTVTAAITGSVSGSAATVTTAAQPSITSVGTLSALTVTAAIVGSVTGSAATATDTTNAVYSVAGKNVNIAADTNLQTWADTLPRCGHYDISTTTVQGALPAAGWHIQLQRHSNDTSGNLYHVLTATGLTTGSGIIYTNTRVNASWGGWVQVVTTTALTAITSVGTLTALTVSGAITVNSGAAVTAIINGATTGVGNIGSSTVTFNTAFLKATTAQYADLAEKYTSDKNYVPGTVVVFGGDKEITISTVSHDTAVAGVISSNPAYLMNSELDGLAVALQGRVPCRVQGPISKGDLVVTSDTAGVAQRLDRAQYFPGCVIGKALEDITEDRICTIEVVVGRV